MGRVIAVANQKGGVGKTTSVTNLAAAVALKGRRVLVVDLDPQGNATSGLGIDKNQVEPTTYHLLRERRADLSSVTDTAISTLGLLPANSDLVAAEIELASVDGRETALRAVLAGIEPAYDFVFIDCPPSLGVLTLNALVAADSVLVPLQCEYYALEGVSSLMETINAARQHLNPSLVLEGVLLTMYDGRTNLARQVSEEAREFFGDYVFASAIPRNVRISESPSFGQPILLYDANSAGALAYQLAASELEKRVGEAEVARPRIANH